MTDLVVMLLVFVGVGVAFLATNLFVGRLIRPNKPTAMKGEIYECGEETIGSAWIQFDLRFYVVALLFVIFDVELAFFFPWAVVFGSATRAGNIDLPPEQRMAAAAEIQPIAGTTGTLPAAEPMQQLAWFAFADILFFFGVLLVGFAYLWRRGDLDWVRSTAGQLPAPQPASETRP